MNIELGSVNRPAVGQTACGDGFSIHRDEDSFLLGLADGLGHGPEAEIAARAFAESIGSRPTGCLDAMMNAAHARLANTRGAAAALLRLDLSRHLVEFVGVGNIHLHAVAPIPIRPVCVPGIVGHRLRKVHLFEFELPSWGLLAICSDGISSRVDLRDYESLDVQDIADSILESHGKDHDDATCVIVRFGENNRAQ